MHSLDTSLVAVVTEILEAHNIISSPKSSVLWFCPAQCPNMVKLNGSHHKATSNGTMLSLLRNHSKDLDRYTFSEELKLPLEADNFQVIWLT